MVIRRLFSANIKMDPEEAVLLWNWTLADIVKLESIIVLMEEMSFLVKVQLVIVKVEP